MFGRRQLLVGGAAALAGSRFAPSARAATWPDAPLTGDAQFMPWQQIHAWQEAVDAVGLRATGSRAHHGYVDRLGERMERVGMRRVRTDPVPLARWEPSGWGLDVVGGGAVDVSWYVPYSGSTGPDGVTAPLSTTPKRGTIGLVTVRPPQLPYLLLDLIDWNAPGGPRHAPGYDPLEVYDRPWFGGMSAVQAMDDHKAAGAVGLIVVLDLPAEVARGQYLPYDGINRGIPSLLVDRDAGARLAAAARDGASARLRLEAAVQQITTPNLYGIIPGASDELVMVQSHTDGTNGLEENGPEAILAMAQYLARIPREELPRSVLVVLSTGHMAGTIGTDTFLRRHKDGLIARTVAGMSLEHLGARPWLPGPDGRFRIGPGHETTICFTSPHPAVIGAATRAHLRSRMGDARVLRPFLPDTRGESPSGFWWPGDGEGLWRIAGLPSLQLISGPAYLLNAGMPTMRFVDTRAIRRQAVAFTDAVLELTRVPRTDLDRRRIDDPAALKDLLRCIGLLT
ncbi:Zn-dependent exopeptidase M28 [Actinomadura rayongensis]|uniref:PA domain protein n=1 Tax=Actinomadura rayongensis TaxID=1429076 RepID=A0A6I4WFJ1_9ACTN|nr:Zn-dependent exopeptidase M28 [Actinomadura rayongensis]MXQ65724.1 PA domain protein [Actinomadura rayongensis]